ncbi:MAG: DUF4340 domain-containing protein [Planctomycetota bacterium]|nr:MAG: DUF4340 domain-containing protein [Planctomycetota bacterium]
MTEAAKTSIFVGTGVLIAVLAFAASREPTVTGPDLGDRAFTRIENAEDVVSLQIARFNDVKGRTDTFKVVYRDGRYVIPSHHDYPADAQEQLLAAAASVMDINIVKVEDDDRRQHELRGLLDPLDPSVGRDTDAEAVGTRVTMENSDQESIADFIVGKRVGEEGNVRFARRAREDQIYTVELDTSKLTTDFGTWIEKDLLRLDPLDVRGVALIDYSIEREPTLFGIEVPVAINQRGVVELSYDPGELKWNLDRMQLVDQEQRKVVDRELAEDEELDTEKLNGLKQALDDLKIVDVQPQPEGLEFDGEKIRLTQEAQVELSRRGFDFLKGLGLHSDQGEIAIDTADGVRYALRFGRVAGADDGNGEGDGDAEAKQQLRRYLWVRAEENLDIFPPPALQEVPPMPEPPPAEVVKKVEDGAAAGEAAAGEAADGAGASGEDADGKGAADEDATGEVGDAAAEPQQRFERLKAEREKIIRDNERKKSEYEAKINKAKEEVAKLNRRFDDWYYIIANDTYQEIHLGADDVLKKKGPPETEGDATGGVSPDSPAGPTSGLGGLGNVVGKAIEASKSKLGDLLPKDDAGQETGPAPAPTAKPPAAPADDSSVGSEDAEDPQDATDEAPADATSDDAEQPPAPPAENGAGEPAGQPAPAE